MISRVTFRNFKILKSGDLRLGPFTLLVGPNASGKSTVLQALKALAKPGKLAFSDIVTLGDPPADHVQVTVEWTPPHDRYRTVTDWRLQRGNQNVHQAFVPEAPQDVRETLTEKLRGVRIYSLDAQAIAAPSGLAPNVELEPNGAGLVTVLDQLRDTGPERFEALNEELGRWLPEFDRVLFDTPGTGSRSLLLRVRRNGARIPARNLSQGTLLALAILTLAYLREPKPIICFEEPDRGIHPRLLRHVRDALYRLSYPKDFGESREPTQVIATTHSPYFLDLFKEHPEEVVIAQRTLDGATFIPLSERSDLDDILSTATLGEVWYTGILGGVPSEG